MLIGVSASGLLFSLLGAQPILIIGFTGPILVFEESLYQVTSCNYPTIKETPQRWEFKRKSIWIDDYMLFLQIDLPVM